MKSLSLASNEGTLDNILNRNYFQNKDPRQLFAGLKKPSAINSEMTARLFPLLVAKFDNINAETFKQLSENIDKEETQQI